MTWQPEIDELKRRREMAKQMGGDEGIARQHSRGRLTVRERIDSLLDRDSFREIETFAGRAEYDDKGELESFTHAARVTGYGKIDGRTVCVEGGDFTIRGGWADPTSFVGIGGFTPEKMSLAWRVPFIRLLDSAGGSVLRIEADGRTFLLGNPDVFGIPAALMAHVPVVSAALGSLGGYPPVLAAAAHFSVMTRNTSELFVAGPPLVKQALGIDITKEELGNYKVHAYQSGVIDNVAEDERDAFRQIRLFLSYLPQNVWQQPSRVETGDDPNRRDEELLSIIPRDRRKLYDIHQIINHVVDKDSMFELSPFYGRSVVTVLARMDGYPVALMGNDCRWFGGAQTTAGCEKMIRFIDFADTFHLPIIYLLDCPGFMIGPDSEKEGIARKSARLAVALAQLTVPGITVILRRSYGVAGGLHGSLSRLNLRYAWPSAEWGSLPLEGGVMAAYRKDIEAASDPKAKRTEIENKLRKLGSPFRTAEVFGVEEIIDPRETRPLLCDFVREAQKITATQLGLKSRVGIRP
jgi:acetyl-CoA carboxylase carboxyltransferase component